MSADTVTLPTPPMIPERPGARSLVPARLRVPYRPRKGRATDDPGYLKTWGSTTEAKQKRRAVAAARHFWAVIGRHSQSIVDRMRWQARKEVATQ